MIATRPDEGWAWIALFASFIEHCISGYSVYAIGYFHIVFIEKFNENTAIISWISAVFVFLTYVTGPLASCMIDKWNCRITMIIGSLVVTSAVIITAFVQEIILAFIFFGIFAGIGIGLIYNTGYIVLAFNFEKKRNLATGFAVSGCGIGPFIFSPIYQMAHHEFGYTGFFLLFGGLTLNACVVGAVLRPSHLEVSSKLARHRNRTKTNTCFSCDVAVMKNRPLILVCLSGIFFNIGVFIVYLHFPKYAMENNSTEEEIAWLLSIAGMCSCVSRILLGMATNSENISEDIIYFGAYSLLGTATLCIPFFISLHYAKVIYALLLGMYSGICFVVINTIILRLTGPNHVAQGTGYVMAFMGIGILVGPSLAGFIIDRSGTYQTSFIIAGISLILGGFLELCSVCFKTDRYVIPTSHDLVFTVPDGKAALDENHITEKTALA